MINTTHVLYFKKRVVTFYIQKCFGRSLQSYSLPFNYRLVHDREIQLHDGTRLISAGRYKLIQEEHGLSPDQMTSSGILKISPEFRIVAIGEPPTLQTGQNWMSPELLSLFIFHEAKPLSKEDEMYVITSQVNRSISCVCIKCNLTCVLSVWPHIEAVTPNNQSSTYPKE